MTGPSEGKIEIDVDVFFDDIKKKCVVYIHVKGYARALVTHVDIEGLEVESTRDKIPAVVWGGLNSITLILMEPIRIDGRKVKKIKIKGLNVLPKGKRSGAFVGIKEGGIYIGFRKEIVRRLEEIARRLQPELFRNHKNLESFLE